MTSGGNLICFVPARFGAKALQNPFESGETPRQGPEAPLAHFRLDVVA
jgi:hypothetical protein